MLTEVICVWFQEFIAFLLFPITPICFAVDASRHQIESVIILHGDFFWLAIVSRVVVSGDLGNHLFLGLLSDAVAWMIVEAGSNPVCKLHGHISRLALVGSEGKIPSTQ